MSCLLEYAGLSSDDIGCFSEDLKEKLEIAFDGIRQEALECKHESERLRSDLESARRRHAEHVEQSEARYGTQRDRAEELERLLESVDSKYRNALFEREKSQEKFDELQAVSNELTYAIRNLENERDMLSDQLKRKIALVDELSEELRSLKSEAEAVRKLKVDTLLRSEEVDTRESSLKVQESRLSEESSTMQRHIDWLEDRLRRTTDQLLTSRRDTTQKHHALESELDLRKTELDNSRKSIENLEECVKKLTAANENYIQKLKQVADEQIRIEQLYGNELDAQKQLVSLYKDQLNDAEAKNTELMEAASSMQSMLKTAYENVARLESDTSALKQQYAEEQASLQDKLQQMTAELERSHLLLDKFRFDGLTEEELRRLNPAVAATLSALKRGHSLTQLYTDYVQVVEDRDQLRLDKQRLTEYVKQMVDEVNEKAPFLRDQQENYKQMKVQLQNTSAQLQSANEKLEESQTRRQEIQRKAGYYQRETGRWKQTCADLSRQVQVLLREVEVYRGVVIEEPAHDSPRSSVSEDAFARPVRTSQLPDSSTMNAADMNTVLDDITSSAASVIDEHLVTWRGLQELQSQNQRLLCVARDLANQLEKKESEEFETSKCVSELSTRLETLTGELEVVRLAAREARTEVQVLIRQRDGYRSLLERYDIHLSQRDSIDALIEANPILGDTASIQHGVTEKDSEKHSTNPLTCAMVDRLEETLASMDAEFKQYREDKTQSDKIYSTTIDQLRKEASEARLLNQKLAVQLDFTHEKLRTMDANVSGYKQEITVLREMNARYSTSAAASEAELTRLREELVRTSDRLLEVEVDARHSARQLEISRANESRWHQEIDALRRQEQLHARLMHQLQVIEGSLCQREAMDRKSSERRVAQLEKELTDLQSAFSEASQTAKAKLLTLEHELELARHSVDSKEQEVGRLSLEISTLEQELDAFRPQKDLATSNENDNDPYVSDVERLREASSRQIELLREVDGLRARLDSTRQHADQMRELAEAAESRLKELTDENQDLEKRLTSDLKQTKQRCEFLEAQLDLEKKERQNLVNENIRTTEEAHHMNAELRRELTAVQADLEAAKSRCESALELEAGAKSAIEAHERLALEARAKYERELAMHAEDVEALVDARQQCDSAKVQLSDLQRKLATTEGLSETLSKELETSSTLWDQEREQFREKLTQSDREQNLMQEQIIKLTQQIVSLRKLMEKSDDATNSVTGTVADLSDSLLSDLKTSEDLLQLVSYLRRQKSIAETTCDAHSAEISRLLLRISSLENQNASLVDELEKERRDSELAAETSLRHSQLMERVEQLNLVTESNRLLRHEREALQTNLDTVEKQLRDLESLVGPLHEKSNELLAQVDSLTSEKRSLEEERDRWKERCNRLVETAQRMDPEQYRLACNERDELQRKLRRTEEEVQQHIAKISEMRGDIEERTRKHASELTEAVASKVAAEELCNSHSAACEGLRRELESKETTVFKLREIGRKYRQEAETLRRQLSVNRSDEAQLQSLSETLTEARADLVTLRSDLAISRSQHSQVLADIEEVLRVLDNLRSHEFIGPIFASLSSSSVEFRSVQSLAQDLNLAFEAVSAELNRLHQQAEEQRERLLRTQLVESQLTKAQRDCSELRARLSELQSVTITPLTSAQLPQSNMTNMVDSESADLSQPHQLRPCSFATTIATGISEPNISPADTPVSYVIQYSERCLTPPTTTSVVAQSVPAWIMRASATVQPVQPTPAITPPNSVRQTAEIRPITSNVATVMPTPASQTTQTTSVACPFESSLTPSIPSIVTCVTSISEPVTSVPSGAAIFQSFDPSGTRLEATSVSVPRATPRRTNVAGQSLSLPEHQPAGVSSSHLSFSWSNSVPVPTSSFIGVTGKRRLEDVTGSSETLVTQFSDDQSVVNVQSPDRPRSEENACLPGYQTLAPYALPDAKRLRQVGPFSSGSWQTHDDSITAERSAFMSPAHTELSCSNTEHQEESEPLNDTSQTVVSASLPPMLTDEISTVPCAFVSSPLNGRESGSCPIGITSVIVQAASQERANSDAILDVPEGIDIHNLEEDQCSTLCEPADDFEIVTPELTTTGYPTTICERQLPFAIRDSSDNYPCDTENVGIVSTYKEDSFSTRTLVPCATEPDVGLEDNADVEAESVHSDGPFSNEMESVEEEEVDEETEDLELEEIEGENEDEEFYDEGGDADKGDSEDEEDPGMYRYIDESNEGAPEEDVIELSSGSDDEALSPDMNEEDGTGHVVTEALEDEEDIDEDEIDEEGYVEEEKEDDEDKTASARFHEGSDIDGFDGERLPQVVEETRGTTDVVEQSHMNQPTHPLEPGTVQPVQAIADTDTTPHRSIFGAAAFSAKPITGLFGNIDTGASGGLFAGFQSSTFSSLSGKLVPSLMSASSALSSGLFRSSVMTTANTCASQHQTPPKLPTPSTVCTTAVSERPTTSEATATSKPKIQPIVWDDAPLPSSSSAQPGVVDAPPALVGSARRKKWGTSSHIRPGQYSGSGTNVTGNTKPVTFGSPRSGTSRAGKMRPGPRRG